MNEVAIRKALDEIREELNEVESRREALLTAHKGLEALLMLRSTNGKAVQLVMPAGSGKKNRPKGTISLRTAVLDVVKGARGTPLHVSEIYRRAQAMGATTEAKEPNAIVDLTFYSLKKAGEPVSKTAGRTWRYGGPN